MRTRDVYFSVAKQVLKKYTTWRSMTREVRGSIMTPNFFKLHFHLMKITQ